MSETREQQAAWLEAKAKYYAMDSLAMVTCELAATRSLGRSRRDSPRRLAISAWVTFMLLPESRLAHQEGDIA